MRRLWQFCPQMHYHLLLYATEEILLVLVAAGTSTLSLSLPIEIAIIVLLAIVVLSYRQTIRAYPQGGSSYIVAKENLGIYPGLVAGGSLMIDYILSDKLQQKWRQLEADIPLLIVESPYRSVIEPIVEFVT